MEEGMVLEGDKTVVEADRRRLKRRRIVDNRKSKEGDKK